MSDGLLSSDGPLDAEAIRLTEVDDYARICIDRPPVNAFTVGMLEQFRRIVRGLADGRKPILIIGAGDRFSAGFDVKHAGVTGNDSTMLARECLDAIQEHPAPVVAAVEWAAVGLGLLIASSADVLVVSRNARLRMPEVTLGIVPDIQPLRRLFPDPWVRRLCMLGQESCAGDMQLDGVGAMICEPGECAEVARGVMEALTGVGPAHLAQTKRRMSK